MRYWVPEDIFSIPCPFCGVEIEFWKDEPFRICPSCSKSVRNIRIDMGCAKWCKHAAECLGAAPEDSEAMALFERLMTSLDKLHVDQPECLRQACRVHACALEMLSAGGDCDPMVVRASSLLCGGIVGLLGRPPQVRQRVVQEAERHLPVLLDEGIAPVIASQILDIVENVMTGVEPAGLEAGIIRDAIERVMHTEVDQADSSERPGNDDNE